MNIIVSLLKYEKLLKFLFTFFLMLNNINFIFNIYIK